MHLPGVKSVNCFSSLSSLCHWVHAHEKSMVFTENWNKLARIDNLELTICHRPIGWVGAQVFISSRTHMPWEYTDGMMEWWIGFILIHGPDQIQAYILIFIRNFVFQVIVLAALIEHLAKLTRIDRFGNRIWTIFWLFEALAYNLYASDVVCVFSRRSGWLPRSSASMRVESKSQFSEQEAFHNLRD